jgi:hypothetical protein
MADEKNSAALDEPESMDIKEVTAKTPAMAAPSGPDLDVRAAASALKNAILAARRAGFVVDFRESDLDRIPISATAKALG